MSNSVHDFQQIAHTSLFGIFLRPLIWLTQRIFTVPSSEETVKSFWINYSLFINEFLWVKLNIDDKYTWLIFHSGFDSEILERGGNLAIQ